MFANAPSDPNHQICRWIARRVDLEHPEPIMVCTVSIVLIHYFREPLFALRRQIEYLSYLAIDLIRIHALRLRTIGQRSRRQFVHPSRDGVHEILQVHVRLKICVPILVVTNRRFLEYIWHKRLDNRLRRIDELGHDLGVVTGSSGHPPDRVHPSEPLVQQSLVQFTKAGHGCPLVAILRQSTRTLLFSFVDAVPGVSRFTFDKKFYFYGAPRRAALTLAAVALFSTRPLGSGVIPGAPPTGDVVRGFFAGPDRDRGNSRRT